MPEKNRGHKELNKLNNPDYLQIWSVRLSAVLGGVAIPIILYSLSHPGFFTQTAICLTELLPVPGFGLIAAINAKKRLKRKRKIR